MIERLRPAFESGEDWNVLAAAGLMMAIRLRPAFEPGEDWNERVSAAVRVSVVLGEASESVKPDVSPGR